MIARGLLAALLILALSAPPAGAHATVVRTVPADGAALEAAPGEVRMRFTEPVDLAPGALRLLDANGRELDTPRPTHAGGDRTTAVLELPRGLGDGAYIVAWRVTSADSHPVSGAFSFTVGDATEAVLYAEGGPSRAVEIAHGIARGIAFLGLALAVGGAGLFAAGAIVAGFTNRPWWTGGLRQLLLGAAAAGATYLVGTLVGIQGGVA